jgi:hypothetical protein
VPALLTTARYTFSLRLPLLDPQIIGVYVRRLHLAFRSTAFEELCTLVTHLVGWTKSLSSETAVMLPQWAYVLPAATLKAHIHSLTKQVEEGSILVSPRRHMEELLQFAPQVPQVHYLGLLHHLHKRSYEEALESFHRYFDLLRAASASAAATGALTPKEATRAPTQWASLNLAALQLSFCQRVQAVAAIQEAVRSAQQQEDNICLAYALLWIYQTQAGSGADAWGGPPPEPNDGSGGDEPAPAAVGMQRQHALVQRCLSRAHELGLQELASLASQALALRCIDVAATSIDGAEPVTPPANPAPTLSVGRSPCLPPVPLALPGVLPSMPTAQPPPLHCWESLRCGAEGCGGSVQLVRAIAWERFGESRLANLYAGLQLKLYRCHADGFDFGGVPPSPQQAAVTANDAANAGGAIMPRSLSFGSHQVRATLTDRIIGACKLAVMVMAQQGEHAALHTLLALRERCFSPPLKAIWLQHTGDVLLRGALIRGEKRRAGALVAQQKELLVVADGPCDSTWEHELEWLLQQDELLEVLTKADAFAKRPATGRGAGAASPKAMLLLVQAKAHAKGGEPLSAMPHALAAMALAEKASLHGLYGAAALELVAVQLNIDAARALSLLQRVRALVMRNGSAYEMARLKLLSAQCRLAMLPPHSEARPLHVEQLQPHILPALADALGGFGRLRCHSEVASLLYIRARIWHSVDSIELRDRDAQAFARAEQEAMLAASRAVGRMLDCARVGALEGHMVELKSFDEAAFYTAGGGVNREEHREKDGAALAPPTRQS